MMNSHEQFQQNTAMGSGSGLTRYRSAPSSYFAGLLSSPGGDGGFGADDFAQLFNPRASSPETQIIFSRFMNATEETGPENMSPPLLPPRKSEIEDYQPPPPPQRKDYSFSNHNSEAAPDSASVDGAFASFNSNSAAAQPKMELPAAAAASSLIRHSSSPAGLFANINIENDEKWWSHSSSRIMEPISEMGRENASDDAQFDQDYTVNPWDDYNDRERFFTANDDQKNSAPNRPKTLLSHHLSLPKTSADLSAMEKLLQDSVPCKIRAKRGCATHPRSIAERVRRTKISERMRKLQELVPNMEKQTNTSDMLDLAVDYIKELQRQVKTLSENQASCSCSTKQR